MWGPSAIFSLSALVALLLVWGAVTDLRTRTISNWLNLAIALLAPLWWWATGLSLWPGVPVQIGLALAVLTLFAALFAAGMMGGGDVKMLAALALWLPLGTMLSLLVIMALVGGAVTIATVLHHNAKRRIGQPEIPYGVAISIAGLWVFGEPYLNHLLG